MADDSKTLASAMMDSVGYRFPKLDKAREAWAGIEAMKQKLIDELSLSTAKNPEQFAKLFFPMTDAVDQYSVPGELRRIADEKPPLGWNLRDWHELLRTSCRLAVRWKHGPWGIVSMCYRSYKPPVDKVGVHGHMVSIEVSVRKIETSDCPNEDGVKLTAFACSTLRAGLRSVGGDRIVVQPRRVDDRGRTGSGDPGYMAYWKRNEGKETRVTVTEPRTAPGFVAPPPPPPAPPGWAATKMSTGRFSSSGPNLANAPMTAPKYGKRWYYRCTNCGIIRESTGGERTQSLVCCCMAHRLNDKTCTHSRMYYEPGVLILGERDLLRQHRGKIDHDCLQVMNCHWFMHYVLECYQSADRVIFSGECGSVVLKDRHQSEGPPCACCGKTQYWGGPIYDKGSALCFPCHERRQTWANSKGPLTSALQELVTWPEYKEAASFVVVLDEDPSDLSLTYTLKDRTMKHDLGKWSFPTPASVYETNFGEVRDWLEGCIKDYRVWVGSEPVEPVHIETMDQAAEMFGDVQDCNKTLSAQCRMCGDRLVSVLEDARGICHACVAPIAEGRPPKYLLGVETAQGIARLWPELLHGEEIMASVRVHEMVHFKPKYCKHCGHSYGCMCPREEEKHEPVNRCVPREPKAIL